MSAVGSGERSIQPIHQPDFTAEVSFTDGAELKLTGNADSGTAQTLLDLVADLHAILTTQHAREVVVDLRTLEFMSAGAFNTLVAWLGFVNDLPPAQRYRMRFRSSADIMWQRRSLRTLSCFATDIVAIET